MLEAPTDWSQVKDALEEKDMGQQRYAFDAKLHVQFYLRPILLMSDSEAAQRPIYKDVEHVRVLIPGDKLNIIDRIAAEDDRARFAAQYAKFKAGMGSEVVGTRLEAVPWMTRAKVEEYKFFNVFTVEQLAAASDEVGQKFPGFQEDRRKAAAFLEAAGGTNTRVSELEAQVEELRKLIAAQAGQGQAKNKAPAEPVKP